MKFNDILSMLYSFHLANATPRLKENTDAPPTPKPRPRELHFPLTLGIPTIRLPEVQSLFP